MSTGLRARGPQGGLAVLCLASVSPSIKQRGGTGMISEGLSRSRARCVSSLGEDYLELLKFPLIKIQLTTSARKSRVKG